MVNYYKIIIPNLLENHVTCVMREIVIIFQYINKLYILLSHIKINMKENKTHTVFVRCPDCNHLNITDEEFYRLRCSECGEIFINERCTLHL